MDRRRRIDTRSHRGAGEGGGRDKDERGRGGAAGTMHIDHQFSNMFGRPTRCMQDASGSTPRLAWPRAPHVLTHRKSVVQGTSVAVRGALGGRRIIKKKKPCTYYSVLTNKKKMITK